MKVYRTDHPHVWADKDGNRYSEREVCYNCRVALLACTCGEPGILGHTD